MEYPTDDNSVVPNRHNAVVAKGMKKRSYTTISATYYEDAVRLEIHDPAYVVVRINRGKYNPYINVIQITEDFVKPTDWKIRNGYFYVPYRTLRLQHKDKRLPRDMVCKAGIIDGPMDFHRLHIMIEDIE